MLSMLLERLMSAEATARGELGATLHDPCAAAALAAPHYFRFEERHLAVRAKGSERGRLVPRDGASGPPIRYAMEVDATGVAALCLERLRRWSLEETGGAQEDGCGRSR
jgi:inosine-uridine nucleoside N-ribohydrolase